MGKGPEATQGSVNADHRPSGLGKAELKCYKHVSARKSCLRGISYDRLLICPSYYAKHIQHTANQFLIHHHRIKFRFKSLTYYVTKVYLSLPSSLLFSFLSILPPSSFFLSIISYCFFPFFCLFLLLVPIRLAAFVYNLFCPNLLPLHRSKEKPRHHG